MKSASASDVDRADGPKSSHDSGCGCGACAAGVRADAPPLGGSADSIAGDATTAVNLAIGSSADITIETLGDHDWVRVNLIAGQSYTFHTSLTSGNADSYIALRDAAGTVIAEDDDSSVSTYSLLGYTPAVSGVYYLDLSMFNEETTGAFRVSAAVVSEATGDAIGNDISSATAILAVNGSIDGSINVAGDHDFYRISLTAGQTYFFRTGITGLPAGAVTDTTLTLRDANGSQIIFDDNSSDASFSAIRYTATSSGTYFLDVGAPGIKTGDYNLTAFTTATPVVFTNDQIALQLTTGYWGGALHHFAVAPGGILTFDISGLTAAGQNLAREAFNLWSDVTGLIFSEVTGSAQIVLDDAETGAFANAVFANGITTSARINVGTAWLASYGTSINSYSFQSYVHEIGHALGLGHGGDYNTTANYATDSLYLNDSWDATIMSYFDPRENSYTAGLGFTRQFALTPMVADGVATTALYGAATTTRTGDTVYGFNNTSGRVVYDALRTPNASYTVYDNGGVDTLDYSGFTQVQRINLNAEAASNVGGRIGNVYVARGSLIENAIGGSGADTLIGNAAANRLIGNDGDDSLNGGGGADWLSGGNGSDTYYVDQQGDFILENEGGGFDSVISTASFYLYNDIETLTLAAGAGDLFGVGNASANTLDGNEGSNLLIAGAGDDVINGGPGVDSLFGQDGADTLNGDAGIDYLVGGNGNDILNGGDDPDALYGEAGDDTLNGGASFSTDILVGGVGNDILNGASGQANPDYDLLDGGPGDDIYYVDTGADLTFEAVGGGIDTVYANVPVAGAGVYLYANVENLVLWGSTAFGVGNELDNRLIGSESANYLLGGAGNDFLDGRGGNDVLFGQAGSDIFSFGVFSDYSGASIYYSRPGADVIADFEVGVDKIRLYGLGFTSFAQVQSAFTQVGADGAIHFGNGEFVVLQHVSLNSLTAADFIFA
jgi:serralysin